MVVRTARLSLGAALAALSLIISVPAAAAASGVPQLRSMQATVDGIAQNGIPPRPAALRPRPDTPLPPPRPDTATPASTEAGDTGLPLAAGGVPVLPADVHVAQVGDEVDGDVVIFAAPPTIDPMSALRPGGQGGPLTVPVGPNAVSMEDVARLAYAAGFRGEDLVRSVAVAYAESSNNANATNTNTDGSTDYGLWQINSIHSPPVPDIFSGATNAAFAFRIYSQRDNTFFPWYAYYNPFTGERRSDEFMTAARAAVERAIGSGPLPAPVPSPGAQPGAPPAQPEPPSPTAVALAGEPCTASWYGEDLRGAPTASGDPFDPDAFTAALYTVPLGSVWTVTNTANGSSVEVVVNDRGPDRATGRCIDLTSAAFSAIAGPDVGTIEVVLAPA